MRHVSIAELKANADEIVAAAIAGEDIAIVQEGLNIAKLVGAKLVGANRPELVDTRTPEQKQQQREAVTALIELGREIRAHNGPTTAAEIKEWIEDGARVNVVIDASAMGAMLLPDEDQSLGEFTGSVCLTAGLHVPPVWRAEVASLLLKAFRNGRISGVQRLRASQKADLVARMTIVGLPTNVTELIEFAISHALRAHDATYVQLARTLGIPLLTSDKPMQRAAVAAGIELLLP